MFEKYESWLDIDWLVSWNVIELIIYVSFIQSQTYKYISIIKMTLLESRVALTLDFKLYSFNVKNLVWTCYSLANTFYLFLMYLPSISYKNNYFTLFSYMCVSCKWFRHVLFFLFVLMISIFFSFFLFSYSTVCTYLIQSQSRITSEN